MENKIVFIGDRGTIEFLKIYNVETFFSTSVEETEKIIMELNLKDVICVFITEDVFDFERFKSYLNTKKFMVIPSLKIREKKGVKIIEDLIKKATGLKGE